MDLVQLLFLWSLVVTCNVREISALVDYKKDWHAQRILRLRKIEKQIETPRHWKDLQRHHSKIMSSRGGRTNGKTVYKDTDCVESFMCPLSSEHVTCITMRNLCNNESDCPHAEDEDPVSCLFFKMTNHFVIQNIAGQKHVLKTRSGNTAATVRGTH